MRPAACDYGLYADREQLFTCNQCEQGSVPYCAHGRRAGRLTERRASTHRKFAGELGLSQCGERRAGDLAP